MTLALRFISGKYQGGEFPLEQNREVVVGRSSDLDMVLVEEMVSRRHARMCLRGEKLELEDLGSTNGTFVNGERVHQATVGEGDRILIGSNILRVVGVSGAPERRMQPEGSTGKTHTSIPPVRRGVRRPDGEASTEVRMSGELQEIPLPDLLQLFGTSKKDGVLLIDTGISVGRIVLKSGLIHDASLKTGVEPPQPLKARTAVYRMLTWDKGVFELDPPDGVVVEHPLDANVQEVLMDAFRQRDEMSHLLEKLPSWGSRLSMRHPLSKPLSELNALQLSVFQSAINQGTLGATIDTSPHADSETAEALALLIDNGFLQVIPPDNG